MNNLAQLQFGDLTGFGPLGTGQGEGSVSTFTKFVSSTIGLMTLIAFIWFVFLFVTGAIGMMSAGSDKASLENARKRIVNGIIGVVVVIGAVSIISLIGFLLGIDILNLPKLFGQIQTQ
jgi:hypothetical protein